MTFDNTTQNPSSIRECSTSPLSPTRLVDLYFRPRKYFADMADFVGHRSAIFIAIVVMGASSALKHLDNRLDQVEFGYANKNQEQVLSWLVNSWTNYWLVVALVGLFTAVFSWYLGGWWYKQRLHWSGATDATAFLARRVYTMQEFVYTAPVVIAALAQTGIFSNYRETWQADELWAVLVIVFSFWSCWTSYIAATTVFPVSRPKARLWFLVLPVLVYVAATGVLGLLYAF